MFNLLVKYEPWGDGRDTIPYGRALQYTEEPLVDRFSPGGQLDLDALVALPTLFVQEIVGQADQIARVGTIIRARISGRDILLDYSYDLGIPAIPNKTLQGFAAELHIADLDRKSVV